MTTALSSALQAANAMTTPPTPSPSQRPLCHPSRLLAAALWLAATPCLAAESYDNCTGFIESVPVTITAQGTWCLRGDLATPIAAGAAIEIGTSNVTLDCNHFKLGGLAGGLGTTASGVSALDRSNLTIRQCNIRGFMRGIYLRETGSGAGGHLVEDNRLDGNTLQGISVRGDGSVIRRNMVLNTGGSTTALAATAIATGLDVDVIDNTVDRVTALAGSNNDSWGIHTVSNTGGSITGNRVRRVAGDGSGDARSIQNEAHGNIVLSGNQVIGDGSAGSLGIACVANTGWARGNTVAATSSGLYLCRDAGANDVSP